MPLTRGHDAYAAIHEKGLNTFIGHVYGVRRYYFQYAAPPLGSGTPGVDFEVLPPLPIPVGNFGLAYSIRLSQPIIDFAPQDASLPLPAPLTLGPNQFSLTVETVEICVLCGVELQVPGLPQPGQGRDQKQPRPGRPGQGKPDRVCSKVQVWAVGHPTVVPLSPTDSLLGLQIDDIAIKDTGALEPVLDCVAEEVANALLDKLQFTLTRIALGAFPLGLVLAEGPEISDDQLKVWAKIV